jgi:CRP/FNR family cyclic AMP-dependent transcriptional regulator
MAMETLERVLAEHPFFQGLERPYIQLLAECASRVRFDPGEVIFREGEPSNLFYLIRHGKVAVETFVPNRGPIAIQTLGEGQVLGWSWLVEPYRRRFDARAVELTRAIALDGQCLRGRCEEDHHFGYELMKRVAHLMDQRLQATRLQLLDLYDDVRS